MRWSPSCAVAGWSDVDCPANQGVSKVWRRNIEAPYPEYEFVRILTVYPETGSGRVGNAVWRGV